MQHVGNQPDFVVPQDFCPHLRDLLQALLQKGFAVTYAGQAWSKNCRCWIYLDQPIDAQRLHAEHRLDACVIVHTHLGTHDGREHGLVCTTCHDAIVGPPG